MRLFLAALAFLAGAPAGASLLTQVSGGIAHVAAQVSAVLPNPAAAAVMFAGLGLVAGAQRVRTRTVAD